MKTKITYTNGGRPKFGQLEVGSIFRLANAEVEYTRVKIDAIYGLRLRDGEIKAINPDDTVEMAQEVNIRY